MLFFIVGTYVKAQDTLTYKGLIMTPISKVSVIGGGPYISCSSVYSPDGIENIWFQTDTSFNYSLTIGNGVFITSYYEEDILTSIYQEDIFKMPLTRYKEFRLSTVYDSYKIVPTVYFRECNLSCEIILFYVLEVEFKYVLFRNKNTVRLFNVNAQKEQEMFIEYPTITYFITEIMSIKPYKVTDEK